MSILEEENITDITNLDETEVVILDLDDNGTEDRIGVFAENMELANHIVKLHEPKEDSDKEESKK